eukprot:4592905-Alexandrium_andersonii.AAC.1
MQHAPLPSAWPCPGGPTAHRGPLGRALQQLLWPWPWPCPRRLAARPAPPGRVQQQRHAPSPLPCPWPWPWGWLVAALAGPPRQCASHARAGPPGSPCWAESPS